MVRNMNLKKILNLKKSDGKTLKRLVPWDLLVLKTALARVAPAKPHSADVDRLMSLTSNELHSI